MSLLRKLARLQVELSYPIHSPRIQLAGKGLMRLETRHIVVRVMKLVGVGLRKGVVVLESALSWIGSH